MGSALGRPEASSARHPEKAQRCLAEWVASSAGAERELACQPALHVAGALAQRLVDFLSPAGTGEASAARACTVLKARLKVALEPSLVSVDAVERREAVRHLSRALGQRPAQVLLEAVAKRPTSFDAPVADGLVALSQDGDEPAGRALLLVATPANQTHVNRLLAVYAQRRDELRPKLAHPAPEERRAAVSALAALAPLSAPHVSPCLEGPVASVRLAAAKGLARGNSRTPQSAAAACDWSKAAAAVESAAASKDAAEHAAAAWAAPRGPTTPRTIALALTAISATDPETLAAGLTGVARHRQKAQPPRAIQLSAHPSAPAPAEALGALVVLDPGQCRANAVGALEHDEAALVRKAAALALAVVGGPQAAGALNRAARNDSAPSVKLAAAESLRKLSAGSHTP